MRYEKALEFFSQQMREADAAGYDITNVEVDVIKGKKILITGSTRDGSTIAAAVVDDCDEPIHKVEDAFFSRSLVDLAMGKKTA